MLVRNGNSQASSQTCWFRAGTLTRGPGRKERQRIPSLEKDCSILWFHFLRLAKVQVFLSLGFMSKPQENDVTTRPLLLLTAAVPAPGLTWLASNPVKLPALFIFLHLQSWLWSGMGQGLWFCCSRWYGKGCGDLGQVGSGSWCLSAVPCDTHRCVHADLLTEDVWELRASHGNGGQGKESRRLV